MVEIRDVADILGADAEGSVHPKGKATTVEVVRSITVAGAAAVADDSASVGTHACGRLWFGENGRG